MLLMFLDLVLIFTIIIIVSSIIAIIISKRFSNKMFNKTDLIDQHERQEILDKYKLEIGFENISLYISTYETTQFQIGIERGKSSGNLTTKQNLVTYCQVYNINCDILLKKDLSSHGIIYEKEEIKQLIELFASILDNSKYDDKKEKLLKDGKILKTDRKKYENYDEIILINDVKELKKLCKKAIKEKKNIIVSEINIGKEEGEEHYTRVFVYLPLYCKVYNINYDILYRIDPYGYEILEKEEILKLIELFTFVLDNSKYDEEKERILNKALGWQGYDRVYLINSVKALKVLCEKAIKKNKNIIQQGE